ncbi:hypothetical protein B0T24DRAFT_610126 [Lasiosphaeria ovina]|uniref:Uncharacterized protein n=1 Tax=Lasiosphaeria ovina TaxID=92902 RepID=A0AAE0KMB9_9PEZI|nr:hypothetical protein B0T24DRAFT_610126 [Lasiosphaeria ovina]
MDGLLTSLVICWPGLPACQEVCLHVYMHNVRIPHKPCLGVVERFGLVRLGGLKFTRNPTCTVPSVGSRPERITSPPSFY